LRTGTSPGRKKKLRLLFEKSKLWTSANEIVSFTTYRYCYIYFLDTKSKRWRRTVHRDTPGRFLHLISAVEVLRYLQRRAL
jgi:hypothetical protein